MSFTPPERRPNVVYLDHEEIDRELVFERQADLREIIKRESEEGKVETTAEAGGNIPGISKLRAAISAYWTEGEETEFVKSLDHPDAKLALFLETLEEDSAIRVIGENLDEEGRNELENGEIVLIRGSLRRTPLRDLKEQLDMGSSTEGMRSAMSAFKEVSSHMDIDKNEIEETEEKIDAIDAGMEGMNSMAGAFAVEEDIYRTRPINSEVDFVMDMDEELFDNTPLGFPSASGRYYTIGKVMKKFDKGDDFSLIRFSDMVGEENPREPKMAELKKKRNVKDMAKEIVSGRDIEDSEFDISHPDVQIKPLVIY